MNGLRWRIAYVLAASMILVTLPVSPAKAGFIWHRAITFDYSSGSPASGAFVSTWALPEGTPDSFNPTLQSTGTADGTGTYEYDEAAPAVAADSTAPSNVNTIVMAVDPSHTWLAFYVQPIPTSSGFSTTLTMNSYLPNDFPGLPSDISSQDLTTPGTATCVEISSDPDGGDPALPSLASDADTTPVTPSGGPCTNGVSGASQAKALAPDSVVNDNILRWAKVLSWHVGAGIKGTWLVTEGRNFVGGVGVKIGSGDWEVGGTATEETARTDQNGRIKTGGYHRYRYMKYRYYEYKFVHCTKVCTTKHMVLAHHWTGELNMYSATAVSQPTFQENHSVVVGNVPYVVDNHRNTTFGAGVSIFGLSLSAHVGYTSDMSLKWEKVSGCNSPKKRYLYGKGVDVTQAGTIFSTCT